MIKKGYYGHWGGAFIPEILFETFKELNAYFAEVKNDPAFWQEYLQLMSSYSCRPTPLTYAENLSNHFGGARIYIKREDLNHTGAHKANNVMGQGLLVKRMGKKRVIAETGAGQHGVATATMAAKFGFECTIYMGEEDVQRQRPNVFWMEKMGATVVPVTDGSKTLKDAINEAFRDWVSNMDSTHYVLGTVCGPHPFPEMVAWFQSIIGSEAREQILKAFGKLPARVYACVGGGSNAMGIFQGFLRMTRWPWSGLKPAAEACPAASMRRDWQAPMPLPVWRRGIKPCFCRIPTARCLIRIQWLPASIISGSPPSFANCGKRAGSALQRQLTKRLWRRWS